MFNYVVKTDYHGNYNNFFYYYINYFSNIADFFLLNTSSTNKEKQNVHSIRK